MPDGNHDGWKGLLALYELGRLSLEERDRFEAHAMTCDSCFAELERGSIVAATLRDRRERFLYALRSGAASDDPHRARKAFGSWLGHRALAPALVAAAVLAAVVLVSRDRADVRSFATFPNELETTGLLRAPGSPNAVEEALEVGATRYNLGQFDEAERWFEAALARDSTSTRALYALGLCKAQRAKPDEAVGLLRDALRTASTDDRPRVTWALANAHLAAGEIPAARQVLEDLRAGGGQWSEEAGRLLQRLPR